MKPVTQFLVLFPGAWGNHSAEDVRWWFERFQPLFSGYHVVPIVYEGNSIDEIARNACLQLKRANVPPGSLALCYSMGSQILRAVAARDKGRFAKAVFVSGLERHGIGLRPFANIALIAFYSFALSLLTGKVFLRTVGDCHRLMFSSEQNTEREAEAMLGHMRIELMWWKIAEVFLPVFRRTEPALAIPLMVVVPASDAIVLGATYKGEHPKFVFVTGGHAFIRHHDPRRFEETISRIAGFLTA